VNRASNVREFRALETKIVASEQDVEAMRWRQAELAAVAAADGMTGAAYGEEVGKSKGTINTFVRMWKRWSSVPAEARPRFADAYATARVSTDEIITKAEQTRREKERQVPTRHEDKVEMATKLLADPKVAKGVMSTPAAARTVVQEAVRDHNQNWKQVRKRHREAGAKPMAAIWTRISIKIGEWGSSLHTYRRELAKFTDEDLAGLNDYGKEQVGKSLALFNDRLAELQIEVNRWRYVLESVPEVEELPVIDLPVAASS
jgi:hypothetical protein